MTEGRRSQVVLLDERRLDIIIQPKLYAGELLDIVASHFNLKEKEYFGLALVDDTGQYSWLQLDRKVLDHDFSKRCSSRATTLILYFLVKYFVESIVQLQDGATVEAFYLQAKSLLFKGELEVDSETLFQLAALVLQATCGDYVDDQISKSHLKRLPVLSTSVLKEHPSIAFCEEKVIEHYKKLAGRSRGDAIVNYVSIVETLPTYGQHYYEIKDKTGAAWWLGISYRGISQYDKNDRHTPRRVFLWKQLENLYFRDRKFTIEVHEARRVVHTLSSFNLYEDAIEEPVEEFDDLSNAICDPTTQVSVSRRTLAPANVTVYVWFAATPTVTKCIWSMAIAQHQFFLDRRHRKSQVSAIRSLSQIAAELSRSIQSLSSASSQSNLSRSNSSNSLPAAVLEGELSEESKAAKIEMLTALRARKDALEDALKKKTEELKTLCLKEGELTGELPPETPLHPGEMKPQVRRRIGTSFILNDKLIYRAKNKERETLNELELEYEIQSKITSAAFKLANDCTARKSVRKQRKVSYHQATTKLRDIEKKLCTLKKEKECVSKKRERKSVNDGLSEESSSHSTDDNDLFEDSGVHLTGLPETLLSSESINTEKTNVNNSMLSVTSVPPCSSLPQLIITSPGSAPPSPAKRRQRHQSLQHEPLLNRNQDSEVITYESCTWRTMSTYSAGSEYDTISCGSGSVVSLRVPYRNRFESNLDIEGTNLYSVPNQRASQAFESQDDFLVGVSTNEPNRQVLSNIRQNEFMFHNLSDSAPLSTSYDEKLLYNRSGEEQTSLGSSRSCSNHISFVSAETSSLNCFDSHNQQQVTGQSCRINEKFSHFHSENSLNKAQIDSLHHNLDQTHISEPDLNNPECEKSIPHVYSVPLLRDNFRNKSLNVHLSGTEIYAGANNQSISQVAELVQASMLLQDGKRTASVNSLEYSSPKTKTKEWIETSLDSPLMMRKQKPKYSNYGECEQYLSDPLEVKPQETVFSSKNCGNENIQINLSPYLSHPFHQDLVNISPNSNSAVNVPHSPSLQYSLSDNHQSTLIDFTTLQKVPNTNSSEETTSPISLQSFCFPSTEQQQMFYQRPIYNSVSCLNSEQVPLSIEFSSQHQKYFSSKSPHHPTSGTLTNSHFSNSSTDDAFLCNQHTNVPNTAEPQQPSKCSLNSNTPLLSKLRTDFHQSDICSSFEQFQETSTVVQEGSAAEPLILTQSLAEEIVGNQHSSRDVSQYISAEQQFINSISDTQQTYLPNGSQLPTDSWMMPVVASVHETSIPLSPSAPPSFSFPANVEVNVVSLGHFQPYWEETKPYEMADFYKYSTKHRKQQHKTVVKVDISSESDVTNKEERQNCDWTQMAHNPVHASSTLPEVVESHCHRNEADSVSQDIYTSHRQQKKEILVNAHVAVVDHTEYKECSARDSGQEPMQLIMPSSPQSAEENCSLGEAGLRISLAEAFHEEMLAWYEDQDAMKKATLV